MPDRSLNLDAAPPQPISRPPSQPPEASPNPMSDIVGGAEAPQPPGTQVVGMALQGAMVVEKVIMQLAGLLPAFQPVAAQIIPQLKRGIMDAVNQSQAQGPPQEQQAGPPMMGEGPAPPMM